MRTPPGKDRVTAQLAARVVTAYVSSYSVASSDVAIVVKAVGDRLASLVLAQAGGIAGRSRLPSKVAVGGPHITCFLCGRRFRMLKRHLSAAHEVTPTEYREIFGLPRSHPMVAPDYAERRSARARGTELGHSRR